MVRWPLAASAEQQKNNSLLCDGPRPVGVMPLVRLQEEAVSFYTKREAKLKEEYRKEKEKVHTKPLGMAFVTFQNEAMTAM